MASPAELDPNLPDTLPADFGEWDSSDSPAPAESPSGKPLEKAPKETAQRESARREAEALDSAKRSFVEREVNREFEPPSNAIPFPEHDEAPVIPRGIPAPVIRPPRTSPPPSPVSTPSSQEESALTRRLNAVPVDKAVSKLPALETRKEGPTLASVSLSELKPDKPLFSSVATPESESEEEGHATLLNDLLEDEAERKTRRKWITSGCIFGGALLLVVFQLIHYATAGKIKHIVNTPQATATIAEPDPNADAFGDSKLGLAKPSPAKQDGETEVAPVQVDSTLAKSPAAAQTRMMESQLTAPTRLPQSAKASTPSDAPPPSSLGGASMAALNGNNSIGGVFGGGSNAKVSGPRVVAVSAGVAVGMLIHQTQPVYPPIARSARVQGTVVMTATISRTGKVTNLRVVSGPPMLRQSALDAVKTWQYKPYTLNGEPTDVDTTINVAFSLGG